MKIFNFKWCGNGDQLLMYLTTQNTNQAGTQPAERLFEPSQPFCSHPYK
jgi:hypothetical protein